MIVNSFYAYDNEMTDLLINREKMYRLYENAHGELCLSVVCGDIGYYELQIKLSSYELEKYKLDGQSYLDILSKIIESRLSDFNDGAILYD